MRAVSAARRRLVVLGIDLGGVETRPSGVCILRGLAAWTTLLFTDEELLDFTRQAAPLLVAIDAPLSLPPGRTTMADRGGAHFRPCDVALRRLGIPFFPITLGPMRGLTERGIRLKGRLEAEGFRAVEIYPGGAQDIWGLPRAKRDRRGLRRGLARLGVRGIGAAASEHELDAASGALVGRLYLQDRASVLGESMTGAIIMPRGLPKKRPVR
jgi:predicted nuclease with RNAse H fold